MKQEENGPTNEVVKLWADLFPVKGYTSGFYTNIPKLFIQTPANLKSAYANIEKVRKDISGKLPSPDLQHCADRLLIQFQSILENTPPTQGITDAGDGIFYLLIKEPARPQWIENYLKQVITLLDFENARWKPEKFSYEIKRGCLDVADYLQGCLDALNQKWKLNPQLYTLVKNCIKKYKTVFYEPGLDTSDVKTLLQLFAEHEPTPAPVKGYPNLLNDQYNLGMSAEQIEKMAMDLLNSEMPILSGLADEMAEKLGLPKGSSIETVWNAQSKYYAVKDEWPVAQKIVKVCNAFATQYVVRIDKTDHVTLVPTPDYLTAMVTGGEDRAVDYLTNHPTASLYYTPSKNTSLLTMINIIVHELSHGFNFVKAAQHAGSPLLNFFTPILEVLTEGMAFFREYQYWQAAQELLGKSDLNPIQKNYLELYGQTAQAQEQAVLGAKFETYIWRIIRYIRALCDVKVNGGKMSYTAFLDWASQTTQISKDYLHGECFTFLSQPGYAPCYTAGGKAYQYYQEMGIKNKIPEIQFNTTASNIGFLPWTLGVKQLKKIAEGVLVKHEK